MPPERDRPETEAYAGGYRGLSHGVTLPDDRPIAERGRGCYVESESGDTYVDYMLGSGAVICGHAHPRVREAIERQAAKGSSFILPAEATIELSERLADAVPCADRVIFTCTGSQAVYYALRLARSHTGKAGILKFEGAYHGYHDEMLVSTSWGARDELRDVELPDGTVDSGGVLADTADHTLVSAFNDLDRTAEIVAEHADDLAAVIVEPVHRSLPPEDGFLQGVRDLCDEHGVVLIFDEVVTGFRLAWGGAQERFGVQPDLATYGKTMTGGTPIGAVCGDEELMRLADPGVSHRDGGCLVGSTMNGNPLCAAAANATLDVLERDGTYEHLDAYADEFRGFVTDLLEDEGLPVTPLGEGAIVDYAIREGDAPTDWRSTLQSDADLKRAIEREVVDQGVLVFAGSKKYVSLAHDDEALERTREAYRAAVERIDLGDPD